LGQGVDEMYMSCAQLMVQIPLMFDKSADLHI